MNDLSTPVAPAPNYAAIKQRQQATWASGDYAVIGTTLQIVGESLAEAVDVRADERVLDVAAGNGNATLAAARRFAARDVDRLRAALLDKGRERAEAEGLVVHFQDADVEDLPFADASFDVVLSTFGAMFAPDHAARRDEMLRVLRPGGRIGLANWTPEGFIGRLFKVIGAPRAAAGRRAVAGAVGHRGAPRELFGAQAAQIRGERGSSTSATARRRTLSRCSATTTARRTRPLPRSTPPGSRRWSATSPRCLSELNVAGRASLVVPSEYLEVVITKA